MKEGTHKLQKRIMVLVLLAAAVMALLPLHTYAAAKKVKPVAWSQCNDLAVVKKKAAKVKKGKTTLSFKAKSYDYDGFVMFKAPKTKTYTFTFSKPTPVNVSFSGKIFAAVPDAKTNTLVEKMVATSGGDSIYLSMGSVKFVSGVRSNLTGVDRYLTKRSAKVRLKKGQKLYFQISLEEEKWGMKLVIK